MPAQCGRHATKNAVVMRRCGRRVRALSGPIYLITSCEKAALKGEVRGGREKKNNSLYRKWISKRSARRGRSRPDIEICAFARASAAARASDDVLNKGDYCQGKEQFPD